MNVIYNITFYHADTLKGAALKYLEKLPRDVHVLLGQGYSGALIASAMAALSERPLQIVLKRKQADAHEPSGGHVPSGAKACIVDDFIVTGQTISTLVDWAKTQRLKVACILVSSGQPKERKLRSKTIYP